MKRLAMAGLLAVLSLQWGCSSNSGNPSGPSGPTYTYPFSIFIGDYATPGSGNGQFSGPEQIAVYNNTLFAVDNGNGRLEKFDLNGDFLGKVPVSGAVYLWGLTFDKNGVLYVDDNSSNAISRFDANLNALGTYTPSITPSGPQNMAADSAGKIYFSNYSGDTLERCNNDGTGCVTVGGTGTAVGQFSGPEGVAVDGNGNVYVAEFSNSRVQKFNSSLASPSVIINTGTANGSVSQCQAIAVDGDGNLLVGDQPSASGPSRLQKFSSSGSFITTIAPPSSTHFGFNNLIGIAVDSNKDVFVSDWAKDVIFKFAPN